VPHAAGDFDRGRVNLRGGIFVPSFGWWDGDTAEICPRLRSNFATFVLPEGMRSVKDGNTGRSSKCPCDDMSKAAPDTAHCGKSPEWLCGKNPE
jgi:hypothetical protein